MWPAFTCGTTREGEATGLGVRDITVSTSNDRENWTKAFVLKPTTNEQIGDTIENLAGHLEGRTRYLKLAVRKAPKATRILLGEIEVLRPAPDGAEEEAPLPPWPRPMHIKRTLDQALLDAGVEFLYNLLPHRCAHRRRRPPLRDRHGQ